MHWRTMKIKKMDWRIGIFCKQFQLLLFAFAILTVIDGSKISKNIFIIWNINVFQIIELKYSAKSIYNWNLRFIKNSLKFTIARLANFRIKNRTTSQKHWLSLIYTILFDNIKQFQDSCITWLVNKK